MKFQIIDIFDRDENNKYVIHLFGRDMNSKSYHLKVNNFKPYFYIKCDELPVLETKKPVSYELHDLKEFHYFNNYKTTKFVKVIVNNLEDLKFYKIKLKCYDQYEGTIQPLMRFLHIKNIQPSNWIEITNYKEIRTSFCNIDIKADWNDISPCKSDEIAPFLIASWDLEVSSPHHEFPTPDKVENKINQIGLTTFTIGSNKITKYIATLKKCKPIENVLVESFKDEKSLILGFIKYLIKLDPDVLTGFNILGFDYKYLYNRMRIYNIYNFNFSRLIKFSSTLEEKELNSNALGFNKLYYITSPGRVIIDVMKYSQREHKLTSYSLDSVASEFINGKINSFENIDNGAEIKTNSTNDIEIGNYISFKINDFDEYKDEGGNNKFKIVSKTENSFTINSNINENILKWMLKKDDLDHSLIYEYQNKDPKHRNIIAKYCIQDCVLTNKLFKKLKILTSAISMSNICYVPINYLFFRGQTIKSISLVSKVSQEHGYVISDKKQPCNTTFQGATVLKAISGYHNYPVSCNDFNSLYPSCIISHNLSPDTMILDTKDINPDTYNTVICNNTTSYNWIKPNGKNRGIIPLILEDLLKNRKDIKKQMEKIDKTTFNHQILDARQNSYKLTANSLYGQMGSSFSTIALKPVAECTTAIGRELLKKSVETVNKHFPDATVIYGDTDSIMTKFIELPPNATQEEKNKAIDFSIECAKEVQNLMSKILPYPHCLAYEKTYFPYILYSKKRYSANIYEKNYKDFKGSCNKGIVLKRRDNANIVKYMFKDLLDLIYDEKTDKSKLPAIMHEYIKNTCKDILNGKFPISYFVISKSLKITKTEPGHKMLANRMIKRGESVQLNDKIKYVFIERNFEEIQALLETQTKNKKKLLQGNMIEHVDFVIKNNLQINYMHYISNQIMKPIIELIYIFEPNNINELSPDKYNSKDINKYNKLKTKLENSDDINDIRRKMLEIELFAPILNKV